MDTIALVEELACMVKDNLSTKHLVLSMEEKFIDLLDPLYSGGETIRFEPMASYQRMLLHRLADIFRLVHESIGEGDDRHLVVERCENSSVPDVLVSDILECNNYKGEYSHLRAVHQLLRRNTDPFGPKNKAVVQVPCLSFDDRQAAYLAARERIFKGHGDQAVIKTDEVVSRPRSVPVVARRMIAHALGKHASSVDACPIEAFINPEVVCEKLVGQKTGMDGDDLRVQQEDPPTLLVKALEHSSGKAAKRMLAQALGLPLPNSSSRASVKEPLGHIIESMACAKTQQAEVLKGKPFSRNLSCEVACRESRPVLGSGNSFAPCNGFDFHRTSRVKAFCKHEPGTATQEKQAQDLGSGSPSSTPEGSQKI